MDSLRDRETNGISMQDVKSQRINKKFKGEGENESFEFGYFGFQIFSLGMINL